MINLNDCNKYKKILAEKGLKNTGYRNILLKILEESRTPLTVEEIYIKMKKQNSAVSLSTVYRSMETMWDKKLAAKTTIMNDGKARYEFNTMEHKHHLICLGCSKIVDISGCPFKDYEKNITGETGFDVRGHNLEMYGYCPACQK